MLFTIIYALVIGAVAGYLGNRLMGNDTSDLLNNVILGIVGSIVGSLVFGLIGLQSTGIIGKIILDVIGACIAIFIYRRYIAR